MLFVRGLLGQVAFANESLLLSGVDWFAIQKLTDCLKPAYETSTAIQLKKLTAGEFFGEWVKCKVQLQCKRANTASFLVLAICFIPWNIEKRSCYVTLLLFCCH